MLERLVERTLARRGEARGERLPLRISPMVVGRRPGRRWRLVREEARALGREGLMLKAREGAYGVGRRKGGDRTDVWWKWKLDPMSVDAVLIYAQRGHGRRSGVYSDYTFAVWSAEEGAREPRAGAVRQGLFGPLRRRDARDGRDHPPHHGRDLRPGAQRQADAGVRTRLRGHRASKRHRSGVAVRFPRMLRWRRDKPVAEADTLERCGRCCRRAAKAEPQRDY